MSGEAVSGEAVLEKMCLAGIALIYVALKMEECENCRCARVTYG